jgi:Tfp pilus assembly protein PilO
MKKKLDQLRGQLGWQGIAGLTLLALTWGLHIGILQPLERETSYLRSQLDQSLSKDAGRNLERTGNHQKELERFYDSLPSEADVTDILASIVTVAEASSVELKQAEYRLDEKGNSGREYSLYYPVQGGYANIRHFVFRVLADHPLLALDQISFQRDKVNDSLLKAEIRFTLFVQTP